MASTRTPGVTRCPDGPFYIDKRYRGIRIGMRVGDVSQGASGKVLASADQASRP